MRRDHQQLQLFEEEPPDESGWVRNNHLHVKHSTFQGGLAERVHRWFRLTPSFGPELVRQALEEMETLPASVVLDPFAGAGTTLIEAQLEGHEAIGIEINPLLHFVCETCLEWDLDVSRLRTGLKRVEARFHEERDSSDGTLAGAGLTPPPIHNVNRWWRSDVLFDMVLLLRVVRSSFRAQKHRRFFELALAGVLVPDLTNVTLGRLQLHFINRDADEINVWETFEKHASAMIEDVSSVSRIESSGTSLVLQADSTDSSSVSGLPKVDRVVTSPPYPNRYSYVWNTRPHLYFLGLFGGPRQASDLDKRTIGGTWGTATSVLVKGEVSAAFAVVEKVVGPVVRQIRRKDNLMANYLMKYFNQLATQIVCQSPLLAPNARMAYVVGCCWLKQVYVETDVLLARVFEGLELGYEVSKIERFRRRHSGKKLHESLVYVRRG